MIILYTKQYIYLCLQQEKNPFYELIHSLNLQDWKYYIIYIIYKIALVQKLQHSNLGKWLPPWKDIRVFMFDLEGQGF